MLTPPPRPSNHPTARGCHSLFGGELETVFELRNGAISLPVHKSKKSKTSSKHSHTLPAKLFEPGPFEGAWWVVDGWSVGGVWCTW